MRLNYSRLQSVEEKRNLKSTIVFGVLTIAVIVFLGFVGVPLLGKVTLFVSNLHGSSKAVTKTDVTPPAPPRFNNFPAFTNQQNITVTGTAEPGATVKLSFGGGSQQILADKDGNFSFNLQLVGGDNNFSAVAVDPSGNQGQQSQTYDITFDNKPPSLAVTSPSDGTSFYGSSQRQVTIQGTTDTGSQITINDRIVSVDDSGNFQYTTTLNDGANPFVVKSTDQAGNMTEKDMTLNFNP
jgi:hypothetical protein